MHRRLHLGSVLPSLSLGLALLATPALAAAAPRTQLVHCGEATCLRVTGTRAHPGVAVRIAGRAVPVEGGRSWRATLPLAVARSGTDASGETLRLTLLDAQTGVEQVQAAILPPGALGKPVELATLTVYAH